MEKICDVSLMTILGDVIWWRHVWCFITSKLIC